MNKQKGFIRFLLLLSIIGLGLTFTYPLAVQADTSSQGVNTELTGFDKISETAFSELYLEENTLAIKVRNKESGYVWSSTIDNLGEQRLNQTWQKFVSNAITIDYLNSAGKEKREYIDDGAKVEIEEMTNGFRAKIAFRSKITVVLEVELNEYGVEVRVPQSEIQEPKNAQLLAMHVYPFLGSTEQDSVPGYLFIPDGVGAVIDFEDTSLQMTSPYQAEIYGQDLGINARSINKNTIPPYQVSMPVFGIVHGEGEQAMLAQVNSAAEYGTITAYKAGLATDFNWITTVFTYRSAYRQPTRSSDRTGIVAYQQAMNPVDIRIQYSFLEGDDANYVGMARKYQEYLVAQGMLTERTDPSQPVRLDFLGGEAESGLLFDHLLKMTTLEQVSEQVIQLNEQYDAHFRIGYLGWTKGGLAKETGNKFPIEERLGATADFQEITENMQALDSSFALSTTYGPIEKRIKGIDNQAFAQRINRQEVQLSLNDRMIQAISPLGLIEQTQNDSQNYQSLAIQALNLSGIGETLYSDFGRQTVVDRTAAMQAQIEALKALGGETRSIGLTQPNQYAWQQMDVYLDIPINGSNYTFVSDTVPFLPIVLKGHVDAYLPYTNFSANREEELLKMVDYGLYPSFLVTEAESSLLKETNASHFYSTQIGQWQTTIGEYYQIFQDLQDAIGTSQIIARDEIESQLFQVSYSNGTTIFVNYGTMSQTVKNHEVPARNYTIVKGE